MATHPERDSYVRCPETCPAVDGLFDDFSEEMKGLIAPNLFGEFDASLNVLSDAIKDQATYRLRDALVDVIRENYALDDQICDLEKEVARLEREIDSMEATA